MKTICLWAFAVALIGCATSQKPALPLGAWFDAGSGKELFVLENDGSGSWKGTAFRKFHWTYDSKARVMAMTEFDRSAEPLRFLYSESDGLLTSLGPSKVVAVRDRKASKA